MSLIPHHSSDPICAMCELKLKDSHPFLADWFRTHVKPHWPSAHVSWSYRDQSDQEEFYNDKKSKLHYPFSSHNKLPALALDLFEINDRGQAIWEPSFFNALNQYNLDNNIKLFWGGKYKDLGDYDHFSIDLSA